MFLPNVIEQIGRSTKTYDIPTKLLENRIVYAYGEIDADFANIIIMQLMLLNSQSNDPIDLYINSPGGSVYQGLAIKDVIHKIESPVNTIGLGLCASMGAYLLASGTGSRSVTENTRIMLHSVSSNASGVIHDMEIDFKESKYLNNMLVEDFVKFSKGKLTKTTISNKIKRDYYIGGEKAVSMGLIDKINK